MVTKEHVFIPMSDGVRLAATLYLPDEPGPWPAILEALPYRKDDITASYRPEYVPPRRGRLRALPASTCAARGRARASPRTSTPRSSAPTWSTVIDWLATRDWSTGNVGMYGTSYSGFNSIQIAMERPPALKAIIPIYATDDRYADDVHYFGGALKQLDQIDYPTYMVAMNGLPPVPAIYGDGWREEWERRVEATEPWIVRLARAPAVGRLLAVRLAEHRLRRDRVPDDVIAGWADGYRNNSFRTFEALTCPKRLIFGPWAHAATDTSLPGPNHDLIPEHLKWWDHWLKGVDNGVDREPPIVLFAAALDASRPRPEDDERASGAGSRRGRRAGSSDPRRPRERRGEPRRRRPRRARRARRRRLDRVDQLRRRDARGASPTISGPTRSTRSPTRGRRSRTTSRSWATRGSA